jgi:predicted choloylglycine hydrolase
MYHLRFKGSHGEDTYFSDERYNTVIEAIRNYKKDNIIEYLQDLLKGKYGFMCQYEKRLNFETVWSSIFDLNMLKIYRAEGDPRRKKFIEDNRLK